MENLIFFLVGVSVASIVLGGWLYAVISASAEKEKYFIEKLDLYERSLDEIGYSTNRSWTVSKLQRAARSVLAKGAVLSRGYLITTPRWTSTTSKEIDPS